MEEIAHVKLLASRVGIYSVFVFKELTNGKFIMCTKLPNWDFPSLTDGETGFIKYKNVKAGDKYFDPNTQTFDNYKYSNTYLTNFVKETDIIQNENSIINL